MLRSAHKVVPLVLRHQEYAQHARLNSLLIRTIAPSASLQQIPLLRLARTANSLTLQLRLAPRVHPFARLVLDLYQRNVSRVEPANLWVQGIGVLLSILKVSARRELSSAHKTGSRAHHAMDLVPSAQEKQLSVLLVQAAGVPLMENVSRPARAEPSSLNPHRPTQRERLVSHVMPTAQPAPDRVLPNVRPVLLPVLSNHQMEDVSQFRLAARSRSSTLHPELVDHVMPGVQVAQCVDSGCGETYFGLCLSALATTGSTKTVGLSPLHGALVGTSSLGLVVLGLLVWRRRARKQRATRTAAFADTIPDPENGRGRWEWGRVWRMRREEGWFSGLRLFTRGFGARGKGRKQFHRELSLRKLGGQGRRPYRDTEDDPRWRNLHPRREVPDTFIFDRPVIPAAPGTGRSWWRDRNSIDSERERTTEGAYGKINPESHFAKTLSSVSGGSVRRPVIQRSETPEAE
ncbi:hypothetical protein FRC11_013220, partial [Ceratobasidium sp. 423]